MTSRSPSWIIRRAVQPVILDPRRVTLGARTSTSTRAPLAITETRRGIAWQTQTRLSSPHARVARHPAHAAARRATQGLELALELRPRDKHEGDAGRRPSGELRGFPCRPCVGNRTKETVSGFFPPAVPTILLRGMRRHAPRGSHGSRPHPRRDHHQPDASSDPRTRRRTSRRALWPVRRARSALDVSAQTREPRLPFSGVLGHLRRPRRGRAERSTGLLLFSEDILLALVPHLDARGRRCDGGRCRREMASRSS